MQNKAKTSTPSKGSDVKVMSSASSDVKSKQRHQHLQISTNQMSKCQSVKEKSADKVDREKITDEDTESIPTTMFLSK
jgi:hypothetical protein